MTRVLGRRLTFVPRCFSSRLAGAAGSGGASQPTGLQLQRVDPARVPPRRAAGHEFAGVPAAAQQVRQQHRYT